MSWLTVRDKMSEGISLQIPQKQIFDKSPMNSPTKVLNNLDLLSVDGRFISKYCLTPGGGMSAHTSCANTPVMAQRFRTHANEAVRRQSMRADVYYDHSVSDEFSHISLTIKERRPSTGSLDLLPHQSHGVIPSNKRIVYTKNVSDCNQIIIAKVLAEDGEEDEIEIVDLDDDEEYHSSFKVPQIQPKENCYPNCDVNVWLRSCEQEIIEPVEGVVSGEIPSWINGSLLRNGPGSIKVGDMTFNHLFDAAALLHRFNISDGKVTYQCRFLRSETYKKNLAANRIVVSEFGTTCAPDPCQSIFERIAAMFTAGEANSDNAMISIYPLNDEYFAFTESPVIHKFDPETLETLDKVNLQDKIGIVNHTSHPHVMSDGSVYNLGMSVTKSGPAYNIIYFPKSEHMFDGARVVAEIPVRWKLHPSYMHTFGITENFFIIVEQPLTVSVPAVLKSHITNEPMISCLKWFPEKLTYIYLIDRETGNLKYTFHAEAFFYLHIINQFEKDDHVVLDICCYRDPEMLNCMYIDSMKAMQNNPDYAKHFRGRPLRFVLPLNKPEKTKSLTSLKVFFSKSVDDFSEIDSSPRNLVQLKDSEASAFSMPDGSIFCKPELLCNLGCETPRINYERHLGCDYQYFYAISSDVDLENPGTLIKVDIYNKNTLTWCEDNCYPSEPIFVPTPGSDSEDDGVILASMVWGRDKENKTGLLVLDARTMTELGRCEFNELPGPVPKCLHGWFAERKN